MDWTRAIDAYCERLGPGLAAEPANAVTNLAFLVAAALMWRRCRGMAGGRWLAAILFAIGIGSGLFHSFATAWAAAADVLPILAFTLVYIYLANRHFLNRGPVVSALGAAAYVPYSMALGTVFGALPFFRVSAEYWPLPVLILAYSAVVLPRDPVLARGLAGGAAILCVSLVFRSLDARLCHVWPIGTHFAWHILNAVMLGWMIEVWRRKRVADGRAATA